MKCPDALPFALDADGLCAACGNTGVRRDTGFHCERPNGRAMAAVATPIPDGEDLT